MTPDWIAQSKLRVTLRRLRAHLVDLSLPAELSAMRGIQGWLSPKEAELLFDLARDAKDGCIVEVGSYRGRSTVALAMGARRGHGAADYTLDPHEDFSGIFGGEFGPQDRAAFYRTMLRSGCWREVRLINEDSRTVALGWSGPVALLWINGDHSFEGVSRDFTAWLPHLRSDAKVVFDDSVDPSFGPTRLIEEILAEGGFERIRTVGKVTVLQRRADTSSERDVPEIAASMAMARTVA